MTILMNDDLKLKKNLAPRIDDQKVSYPLVSILTPILNGDRKNYLDQCIESVLNQSYSHIEHIFVDGGSTDSTLDKLAYYQRLYPKKIKFISEKDKGVGSALKKAYKLSQGKIIGWLDSDDFYELDAIKTAVNFFDANSRASFLYGGCNVIDEKTDIIGTFVIRDFDKQVWLNEWHYIVFCACFFTREVIDRVGFVNNLGNDLYFYLKVAKKFKLHRLEKTFTNWRLHDESISLKKAKREHTIRCNRAKEDFFLVLTRGGSLFSPRAMTYFAVLEPIMAKKLRSFLGFAFPFLKRLSYEMKFCISAVHRSEKGGYALPFLKKLLSVSFLGRIIKKLYQ